MSVNRTSSLARLSTKQVAEICDSGAAMFRTLVRASTGHVRVYAATCVAEAEAKERQRSLRHAQVRS